MKDEDITVSEVLFKCIEDGLVSDDLANEFFIKFENTELGIYLNWLLMRWTKIRSHPGSLPKRFPKLYRIYYIEDGIEYVDKPFKQSIVNWLYRYNSGQYSIDSNQREWRGRVKKCIELISHV